MFGLVAMAVAILTPCVIVAVLPSRKVPVYDPCYQCEDHELTLADKFICIACRREIMGV